MESIEGIEGSEAVVWTLELEKGSGRYVCLFNDTVTLGGELVKQSGLGRV